MKFRKLLAAGLSLTLTVSMLLTNQAYAAEVGTETVYEQETTQTEEIESATETQVSEETEGSEETEATETSENTEETEISEATEETEATEMTEETEETEVTEETEETEVTKETEETEATEVTEETEETEVTEVIEETEITEETENTEDVEIADDVKLAKGSTVSVKDYGANGSDTKADTQAIQKALNAIHKAGGGTVNVPKGTYYIDNYLLIYSNTTLHLDASAVMKRSSDCAKVYDENTGAYKYQPMVKNYSGTQDVLDGSGYSYTTDIIIEGGTWDGNAGKAGTTADKLGDIIQIYCATGVTLQNTTLKSVCGFHHANFASVQDVTVKNVTFSDFVYYKGTDYESLETGADNNNELNASASITSEALQFDNYYGNYICKNITVTGCTFKDVLSGVGNHHYVAEGNVSKTGATNVTVSGNKFVNVANTCINLYNFNTVDVSGNTAENVRSFVRVYGGKDCVISNNTKITTYSDDNKYNMFRVSNGAILTITGNTITGSGNTAIKLDSKSEAEITANTFNGDITYNAIGVDDSTATVYNNKFTAGSIGNIAIYFSASKGNISNNVISTAKLRAIGVQGGSNVTQIHANTVTGGKEQGIYVLNSAIGDISGNSVTSTGAAGIGVTGSSTTVNNIINNTVTKSASEGIRIGEGSVVTTVGGSAQTANTITTPNGVGIYMSASNVATVSYNTISSAGSSSIRVADATAKATVSNNTITDGKEMGIYASGSKVAINSNKITNSANNGIYVKGGSGSIKKNTIKTTKAGSGIYLVEKAKISEISKNKITSPKENGIYVKSSTATSVLNNTVEKAGTRGISFSRATSDKVNGNTVTSPKQDGIYVSEKSTVKVIGEKKDTGNTVTGAGANGICLKEGTTVSKVCYNTVKTSKSANVRAEKVKGTLTISNNTLASAKKQGISAANTKVKIVSNKITKSTTYGIYLEGKSSNATVQKNTVDTVSKGNGIRVCDGKATVTENTVKKTKTQGIYIVKGTVTIGGDNKVTGAGQKALVIKGGTTYMTSGNAKMLLKSGKLIVQGAVSSSRTTITIPDKVKIGDVSYKVTEIADKAFKGNKKVKTLTIGSNISKIGKSAFDGCKNLKTITIKTTKLTAKTVRDNAFKGIGSKCTVKVPGDKVSAYKKLLKDKGAASKIKVVKK